MKFFILFQNFSSKIQFSLQIIFQFFDESILIYILKKLFLLIQIFLIFKICVSLKKMTLIARDLDDGLVHVSIKGMSGSVLCPTEVFIF